VYPRTSHRICVPANATDADVTVTSIEITVTDFSVDLSQIDFPATPAPVPAPSIRIHAPLVAVFGTEFRRDPTTPPVNLAPIEIDVVTARFEAPRALGKSPKDFLSHSEKSGRLSL